MESQPGTIYLISTRYDRNGSFVSRRVLRQVPDDGSVEKGYRMLFEMACEALDKKAGKSLT